MLSNLHTHSVFCDGKNTLEEMVISAIEKGFCSLGFSGHAYTDFDLSYCMTDTDGYINEVLRLKEKYKKDIQIYLGTEEDSAYLVDRTKYDYIIGSSHYFNVNNKYLDVDLDYDSFKSALKVFGDDVLLLAENYYSNFCEYINKRKPDIIGHFDLITKFDELDTSLFLSNKEYNKLAEKYITKAAESDSIFEVNTGAISRGYRTSAYPSENLLHILKKNDSKITLSSDSHSADSLDFRFDETKLFLRDIGFKYLYTLFNGKFIKYEI